MKIFKHLLILLTAILFCFFSSSYIYGETLSVGVSPSSKPLTLEPGDIYKDEIVFWNLSEDTITYRVLTRGFKQVDNMPGTAVVMTEEEDEKALYSASSWFNLETDEIELVPNKNIKVKYTITVPDDVTEGEYNAEIFLLSETNDSEGEGTVASTVLGSGVPFLIKIGDDYVENAELLVFRADKKIYEFPNVKFSTQISNLGNTHISPVGEISITNIFDQEVARIKFNGNNQSLLRETTGTYEDVWYDDSFLSEENEIMFGPMKANLVATYRTISPGFSPLLAETTFWIIPWKIIAGILLGIILIVVFVKLRKRKRY